MIIIEKLILSYFIFDLSNEDKSNDASIYFQFFATNLISFPVSRTPIIYTSNFLLDKVFMNVPRTSKYRDLTVQYSSSDEILVYSPDLTFSHIKLCNNL